VKREVERWRGDLEADPGAAGRREAAARKRAASDRERRVLEALTLTEALHAEQEARARRRA
jgi:hypothetical protein